MKSTWRGEQASWGFWHWLFKIFDLKASDEGRVTPVHSKTDKVPYISDYVQHRWILFHGLVPLIAQQGFTYFTGIPLHPIAAWTLYGFAFQWIGIREIGLLRNLGHIYGYLDGDQHARDDVPNVGVRKALLSLLFTALSRITIMILISYDSSKLPSSMNLWRLPLEVSLYPIVLDFWYYWYHRAMHETDTLWKYHRTHHLTKHPNPLLTAYADEEQEMFDMFGIPALTWATMKLLGLPMGFYSWWIAAQYVVFMELFGHSGLRLYGSPAFPVNWALKKFGMELTIEDHDLHHRKGYKTSGNYGKQTRVWDRIFGTCRERIEVVAGNIDFSHSIEMPIFSAPTGGSAVASAAS